MTFPFNWQKFNDIESRSHGSMHARHTHNIICVAFDCGAHIFITIRRKSVLAANNNNRFYIASNVWFYLLIFMSRCDTIYNLFMIFFHKHNSFAIYRGRSSPKAIHGKMRDVFTHGEDSEFTKIHNRCELSEFKALSYNIIELRIWIETIYISMYMVYNKFTALNDVQLCRVLSVQIFSIESTHALPRLHCCKNK